MKSIFIIITVFIVSSCANKNTSTNKVKLTDITYVAITNIPTPQFYFFGFNNLERNDVINIRFKNYPQSQLNSNVHFTPFKKDDKILFEFLVLLGMIQ